MAGNTSDDAMVDIGARLGENWVITLGSRTIQPVAARVTVREGTYDYEVVLPVRMARERGQLEVTLNDPQGEAIPKSRVSLYTLDGDVILYEKPLDGSRTRLVPAGRYRIVGHPGGPFALYLPAEGHVDVRGDRVEHLTPAPIVEKTAFIPPPAVRRLIPRRAGPRSVPDGAGPVPPPRQPGARATVTAVFVRSSSSAARTSAIPRPAHGRVGMEPAAAPYERRRREARCLGPRRRRAPAGIPARPAVHRG